MIIFVDIDDTICYYSEGNKGDYKLALPYSDRIHKINQILFRLHKHLILKHKSSKIIKVQIFSNI